MAELDVRLVAQDRPLWSGGARLVVARTPEGDIGIMPGHEPVLSLLVDGVVRIEATSGEQINAVVHGGFFSVSRNQVAILAESAELASEIDVERAQRALDRILADGTVTDSERAAEERARSRLKAAMAHSSQTMHLGS
jgi:F-type H+-transporting ATPase subunit epsilon